MQNMQNIMMQITLLYAKYALPSVPTLLMAYITWVGLSGHYPAEWYRSWPAQGLGEKLRPPGLLKRCAA